NHTSPRARGKYPVAGRGGEHSAALEHFPLRPTPKRTLRARAPPQLDAHADTCGLHVAAWPGRCPPPREAARRQRSRRERASMNYRLAPAPGFKVSRASRAGASVRRRPSVAHARLLVERYLTTIVARARLFVQAVSGDAHATASVTVSL